MSQAIRVVYEGGHLRLLDPVELAEGERVSIALLSERAALLAVLDDLIVPAPEVEVTISPELADPLIPTEPLSEEARMRVALAGVATFPSPRREDDTDTEAMQRELDVALKGLPPVSEYIIRERREGP